MKKILLFILVLTLISFGIFNVRSNKEKLPSQTPVEDEIVSKDDIVPIRPDSFKNSEISPFFTNKESLKCPNCNLVIISLTNTRKDHVGMYGYDRNTTPNIDKFFKNSLVFENAFAPASWTLPVATSFFSSLFPYTHGVMDRYNSSRLSDDVLTFTEILKAHGYKTAGFTGGGDYNRKFNANQGFDEYVDEQNYADFGIETGYRDQGQSGPAAYLSIEKLVPLASRWLDEHKEQKKFLLLQGFDTHCPFTPRAPYDKEFDQEYNGAVDFSSCLWTFEKTEPAYKNGAKYWTVKSSVSSIGGIQETDLTERDIQHMIALYDGEIAQADSYLESFFAQVKKLELEKNTIFIFMAEHGDLFGEHGRFMRGGPLRGTFYDPVLNFPLVIKHPNLSEPITVTSLVQTVDLMPTLLDIFAITDPEKNTRQGHSLESDLLGGKATNDFVYSASRFTAKGNLLFNGFSQIEAVRNKEWKLSVEKLGETEDGPKTVSYELYNISKDPQELNNVYDTEKKISAMLNEKISSWVSRYK